jgi:hypothetical protein
LFLILILTPPPPPRPATPLPHSESNTTEEAVLSVSLATEWAAVCDLSVKKHNAAHARRHEANVGGRPLFLENSISCGNIDGVIIPICVVCLTLERRKNRKQLSEKALRANW